MNGDGALHQIYVRYGPIPGFVVADIVSALTLLVLLWRSAAGRAVWQRVTAKRARQEGSEHET